MSKSVQAVLYVNNLSASVLFKHFVNAKLDTNKPAVDIVKDVVGYLT